MISFPSFFIDLTVAAVKAQKGEPIDVWHPKDGPDKKGQTKNRLCLCHARLHRHKYKTSKHRWCHALRCYVRFRTCVYRCTGCKQLVQPRLNGALAYLHSDASTLKATVDAFLDSGGKCSSTAKVLNQYDATSPYFEPTWVRRKIRKLVSLADKVLSEEQHALEMGMPKEFIVRVRSLRAALQSGKGRRGLGTVAVGLWGAVRSLAFHSRCGTTSGLSPPRYAIPPLWL